MGIGYDNSYMNVEEVDEAICFLFRPYDEFRVYWMALEEDEKATYLRRSQDQINSVIFCGRAIYDDFCFVDKKEIKTGIIYNALGLMNEDLKATADKQTRLLKSLGAVKNLRLDQTGARVIAAAESAKEEEVKIPIASYTAYEILKPYRRGAVPIR